MENEKENAIYAFKVEITNPKGFKTTKFFKFEVEPNSLINFEFGVMQFNKINNFNSQSYFVEVK